MPESPEFVEDFERPAPTDDLRLDLEGYEGPIDALLQLARDQKVDLINISILALADQYLEFVQQARRLRLELAADYLVMAAWLAYLKSRLLLPEPAGDDEPSGAEMAAALKFQLQRLQAMQDAGLRLMALPQLHSEFYPRGAPEPQKNLTTTHFEVSLHDLLTAYGRLRRDSADGRLHILPVDLYSVDDALQRLSKILGTVPGWHALAGFLPPRMEGGLINRSALASTFAAALEMTRRGEVKIRQDGTYGTIYLRGLEKET